MLFENIEKMSQQEFDAEYTRANELAAKVGLGIQNFLQSLLGERWLQIEQRIKDGVAAREAKINEAKALIQQFAEVEKSLTGKEWLLLYRRTCKRIWDLGRAIGVHLSIDVAAEMGGISAVTIEAWDITDDEEADTYCEALKGEFGCVDVTDVTDTCYSDVGAGWLEFYRSMAEGQTITTITRRIGNHVVESRKPIPDDRIPEIIDILGW